jgi:hypothetical protein
MCIYGLTPPAVVLVVLLFFFVSVLGLVSPPSFWLPVNLGVGNVCFLVYQI